MYSLALLFALVATAHGQLVSNGTCNFTTIPEAQILKFRSSITLTVNMFEIKRISNTLNSGQCTSVSLVWNDGIISASLKEVVDEKLIDHNATVTEEDTFYNLAFSDFNSNFTLLENKVGDEFVVLYACSNQGETKQEYSWVLGFNTTLTEDEKTEVQAIIANNNLSNATWVESSHTEDSCRSGATTNFKVSSIIVLIVGFVVSKGL